MELEYFFECDICCENTNFECCPYGNHICQKCQLQRFKDCVGDNINSIIKCCCNKTHDFTFDFILNLSKYNKEFYNLYMKMYKYQYNKVIDYFKYIIQKDYNLNDYFEFFNNWYKNKIYNDDKDKYKETLTKIKKLSTEIKIILISEISSKYKINSNICKNIFEIITNKYSIDEIINTNLNDFFCNIIFNFIDVKQYDLLNVDMKYKLDKLYCPNPKCCGFIETKDDYIYYCNNNFILNESNDKNIKGICTLDKIEDRNAKGICSGLIEKKDDKYYCNKCHNEVNIENCKKTLIQRKFCMKCKNEICISCLNFLTPNHICNGLNDNFIEYFAFNDITNKDKHIKIEIDDCPNCHIRNIKDDGCTHIFCPYCKYSYDWKTKKFIPINANTNEILKKLISSNKFDNYKSQIPEYKPKELYNRKIINNRSDYPDIDLNCLDTLDTKKCYQIIFDNNLQNKSLLNMASFFIKSKLLFSHNINSNMIFKLIMKKYYFNEDINIDDMIDKLYKYYIIELNYNKIISDFINIYNEMFIDILIDLIKIKRFNKEILEKNKNKININKEYHKLMKKEINNKYGYELFSQSNNLDIQNKNNKFIKSCNKDLLYIVSNINIEGFNNLILSYCEKLYNFIIDNLSLINTRYKELENDEFHIDRKIICINDDDYDIQILKDGNIIFDEQILNEIINLQEKYNSN